MVSWVVAKLVARLLATSTLWARVISPKYKMDDNSKGVANTLYSLRKKYTKKSLRKPQERIKDFEISRPLEYVRKWSIHLKGRLFILQEASVLLAEFHSKFGSG
jgi:hypothetical protein